MEEEQLNRAIDTMTPSEIQKTNMLNEILVRKHRAEQQFTRKRLVSDMTPRRLALKAAAAAVMICLLIGGSLFVGRGNPPTFTMVAYADGMKEAGVAQPDRQPIEIAEGVQVTVPFGVLKRNQAIVQQDGSTRYNTYLHGVDYFTVSGEGIKSVAYTSELGELAYTDIVMRDQDPDYIAFKASRDGKQSLSVMMTSANPPYKQDGKQVTAIYYKELGDESFAVRWRPWYVSEEMANDENVNPADFPREKITVNVTFTSGQTAAKTLLLSFKSDGTLVAELAAE
ncbi:hypothetical protein EBB07_10950 [Paenibacillaceae bacterium]|nr:hypothetical protein EBB07_10950 [Paenibacillaceae bacterium]